MKLQQRLELHQQQQQQQQQQHQLALMQQQQLTMQQQQLALTQQHQLVMMQQTLLQRQQYQQSADLLAAQFREMVVDEGDHMDDEFQRKPNRSNIAPSCQSNADNSVDEMQQCSEGVTDHPSSELAKPANSGNNEALNSFHNNLGSARMLPPGSHQASRMSQGLLPSVPAGTQHFDLQASFLQQQQSQLQNPNSSFQQQLPRFPISSMLATNPLSRMHTLGQNSTGRLGNQMLGNNSQLHLQMLQQQQQLHQKQMMLRKSMIGNGNGVGVGDKYNNLIGLGVLGNSKGMGGARELRGTGISTPLVTVPGAGNMGQAPMSMSQVSNTSNAPSQYRSVSLAPTEQTNNFRQPTNNLGGHQSNCLVGMSGTRQMHPTYSGISMCRPALNQMQRPTFMSGMNTYTTPTQQRVQEQKLQRLQQQQLQLQQQFELQQQQFEVQQQQFEVQQPEQPQEAIINSSNKI